MQLRAELPPGVRLTRVHAAAGMLCLLLSAVASAQSRPIAHEDVWLMRRIGSPALTRDGRTAVFSVTEPAYTRRIRWRICGWSRLMAPSHRAV